MATTIILLDINDDIPINLLDIDSKDEISAI